MKKLLIFIICISTLLSSCSSLDILKNKAYESSSDGDENSRRIGGITTNYVKLNDINSDSVPEIMLKFNIDPYRSILKETADGFLCASLSLLEVDKSSDYMPICVPRIRKLDSNCNILWDKEYDYRTESGQIGDLVVLPEGGFVFSIQTYPFHNQDNNLTYENSFLIKCDNTGKELWKKEFEGSYGSLLEQLFSTQNSEIIAVGTWSARDGIPMMEEGMDDVVVTKLDSDGNIVMQKSFDGSDFDYVTTANYDEDIGIIIWGNTQSQDGDFAINKEFANIEFVACIDKNLNLSWVVLSDEEKKYIINQVKVFNGFTYILGSYIKVGEAPSNGFLLKLDRRGEEVFLKALLFNSMWGHVMTFFSNNDIAIGLGSHNKGSIILLDKDGNEKKWIENLKFSPKDIIETNDKGFIVTSTREIKKVPHPPYISMVWYDTELIAVKYNSHYKVKWRKTYDKYKDENGVDFGMSLKDGRIIIGYE